MRRGDGNGDGDGQEDENMAHMELLVSPRPPFPPPGQ